MNVKFVLAKYDNDKDYVRLVDYFNRFEDEKDAFLDPLNKIFFMQNRHKKWINLNSGMKTLATKIQLESKLERVTMRDLPNSFFEGYDEEQLENCKFFGMLTKEGISQMCRTLVGCEKNRGIVKCLEKEGAMATMKKGVVHPTQLSAMMQAQQVMKSLSEEEEEEEEEEDRKKDLPDQQKVEHTFANNNNKRVCMGIISDRGKDDQGQQDRRMRVDEEGENVLSRNTLQTCVNNIREHEGSDVERESDKLSNRTDGDVHMASASSSDQPETEPAPASQSATNSARQRFYMFTYFDNEATEEPPCEKAKKTAETRRTCVELLERWRSVEFRKKLVDSLVYYLYGQAEECELTQRRHIQGVIQTQKATRITALKRILEAPGMHFETVENPKKAMLYVKKQHTQVDFLQPVECGRFQSPADKRWVGIASKGDKQKKMALGEKKSSGERYVCQNGKCR